jgi:hypothetical protein
LAMRRGATLAAGISPTKLVVCLPQIIILYSH